MFRKNPPSKLLDIARENLDPDALQKPWRYRRVVHFACAPWMVPCHHQDRDEYSYVPLTGHQIEETVYALGQCQVCGTIHWADTTR